MELSDRSPERDFGAVRTGIISSKGGGSMSRVISRSGVYVFLFLAILLTQDGCIFSSIVGPGYSVSISVSDDAHLDLGDIEFLHNVALSEGFGNWRRSSPPDQLECVNYYRELDEPKFKDLQRYKFIHLGYCYYLQQPSVQTKPNIKAFYLRISDDRAGQEPLIKHEIDRLAGVFYKELETRFGKENLKMENRRTGPPF